MYFTWHKDKSWHGFADGIKAWPPCLSPSRRGRLDVWWNTTPPWPPLPPWSAISTQWTGLRGGCWTPTPSWKLSASELTAGACWVLKVSSNGNSLLSRFAPLFRQCLHTAEQQQQPLWKIHPAPARQVQLLHSPSTFHYPVVCVLVFLYIRQKVVVQGICLAMVIYFFYFPQCIVTLCVIPKWHRTYLNHKKSPSVK